MIRPEGNWPRRARQIALRATLSSRHTSLPAHMMSRYLTSVFVFAAAGALVFAWANNREGYGFDDLVKGKPVNEPEALTPAEKAPMATGDVPSLAKLNEEVTNLIASVAPSVVSINTTKVYYQRIRTLSWSGPATRLRALQQAGLGSGVIISEEGHVVTNYHVVEGVDEIQVVMHDGSKSLATKIGEDRDTDIALLKIQNPKVKKFQPLPFADSDKVRVGEKVFAIGNPYGLRESVTEGMISHRDRQISDGDPPKFQTDASINPGNSGGPLINIRGEIVGINVAIYSGQEDVRVWQGISLAIPSNDAKRAVDNIRNDGRERIGYLGLRAATQPFMKGEPGAVAITEVFPNSPAEQAGFRVGDQILRLGGSAITEDTDFFRRINRRPVGEPVEIEVKRGDQTLKLTATVADREKSLSEDEDLAERKDLREQIGIEIQNVPASYRARRYLPEDLGGVLVTDVEANSPAAGNIFSGDIIYEINGTAIDSVDKFFSVLNTLKGKTFPMKVISRGQSFALRITLNE